jgi:Flp pilus assembly protein TadG
MSERMKIRDGWRNLFRNQQGVVAIIVAGVMSVLVGFAALAIDMSYAYWMRNMLQVTASSAALAGSTQLPNDANVAVRAIEYAQKNMDPAIHGSVLVASDVITGNWDPDTRTWSPGVSPRNAVQVTTRRAAVNGNEVDLFLASAVGLATTDISTSAIATFRTKDDWDVSIVQDITFSFSEEIDDARDADQALLGCIRDNAGDMSQVGLTVFTGFGLIMTPMQSISENYDDLSTAIENLDYCCHSSENCDNVPVPECSGTHVGAGIESAIAQFTDPDYVPANEMVNKAIVIVGDGQPLVQSQAEPSYDASPYNTSCGPGISCTDSDLADMALAAADAAEEAGISIYTVFYDENDDYQAAQFFELLVRGDGIALTTPNPRELVDLIYSICTLLPHRLVD